MDIAPASPLASQGSDGDSELFALLDQELQSSDASPSRESVVPDQASLPQQQLAEEHLLHPAKRRRTDEHSSQCPPHPGFIHGMCIRCGTFVAAAADAGVPLRDQHLQHLFTVKKLLLVLDLDHTLLASTRMADMPEEMMQKADQLSKEQGPVDKQLLFKLPHMSMWTKLRPGIHAFLIEAYKLFELHIYTHGDQQYAAAMAKLLDPDRSLFGGRVISGGDSTQRHVKNLDVVLGADTAVLILDDTEGVWPAHTANLIQVDRYIFFPACVTRFERSHKSLLELDKDEDAQKGMLKKALKILRRVHKGVFQAANPSREDVRLHLAELKRQILAGTQLVFSHVIPLEQDVTQHHLWRLATQMGAICHARVSEDVTHVVSTAQDTDKMHWAKRHSRHRVSPNWVYVSGFKWKKANEEEYPVKNQKADVYIMDPAMDTAAALAGAGGGSGVPL